ncbi:MAG: hypothetical protein ACRC4T_23520 [Cetobacterium sp.]
MRIKEKIFTLLTAASIFTSTAFGIEITPSNFVYNLDPLGLTQDVVFYNRKDRPERVRVSFKPYQTDDSSKYLGDWATVYPKVITVSPDSQKTVKFSIEPPNNLKNGEYRALLYMEELEQKALDNIEGKVVLKNGSTTQINMLINLGVIVYGYVGNPDSLKVSGKVSNVNLSNNNIKFTLENNGEITKPYTLTFSGVDPKTKKITTIDKNIVVVQGYKEVISESIPKDIKIQTIILKDINNNIIQKFK